MSGFDLAISKTFLPILLGHMSSARAKQCCTATRPVVPAIVEDLASSCGTASQMLRLIQQFASYYDLVLGCSVQHLQNLKPSCLSTSKKDECFG